MPGSDLPPPEVPMTTEALLTRWLTAAQKAELLHGVLVFAGDYDERDLETARRTYPGRRPVLNADSGLEVHPAGAGAPAPLVSRPAGVSEPEGGS
ncbi:hypothetical protein ACIQMR_34250 [Streptomyces sp. NPDC091376]|uniref:hypothetical protein n=1 Tax=Streptomyces sp. NPDC091376 TaxID=3365994 RepID=UPI003824B416